MSDFLYHYNHQRFKELKSRRAQNKEIKMPSHYKDNKFDYNDSISFFFEPLPLDVLPKLYKGEHPFYKPESMVYEYRISIQDLNNSPWTVVEHPEKTELLYDDSISDSKYYKEMARIEKEQGYNGNNWRELAKIKNRFKGLTLKYYKLLPSRPNFEEIKTKYAPTVPHVMTYPIGGTLRPNFVLPRHMGKA